MLCRGHWSQENTGGISHWRDAGEAWQLVPLDGVLGQTGKEILLGQFAKVERALRWAGGTATLLLSRSGVSDSCDPMDCSPPGSSVHGIFQARIPEWVAVSFSGDLLRRLSGKGIVISWCGGFHAGYVDECSCFW